MDILSHGLWAAAPFYRKSRKSFWIAFLFGVLPDLVAFVPHTILMILGPERHPLFARPPVSLINPLTFDLYDITHSSIVFLAVFALAYFLNKKRPYWLMWGWGLHILADIPTHSIKFFATPFLWPLSDFRVDGIPWSNPRFIVLNYSALILVYAMLIYLKKRRQKLVPEKLEI